MLRWILFSRTWTLRRFGWRCALFGHRWRFAHDVPAFEAGALYRCRTCHAYVVLYRWMGNGVPSKFSLDARHLPS